MLKLFISSHGHLASGIKSSLDILLGSSKNIVAYDAYVDDTSLKDKMDEFYKTVGVNDQVILLSDLYGGSVNQIMMLYLNMPNTRLVTGVNLALILELSLKNEISDNELDDLIEQSREVMTRVNLNFVANVDNDNFF